MNFHDGLILTFFLAFDSRIISKYIIQLIRFLSLSGIAENLAALKAYHYDKIILYSVSSFAWRIRRFINVKKHNKQFLPAKAKI